MVLVLHKRLSEKYFYSGKIKGLSLIFLRTLLQFYAECYPVLNTNRRYLNVAMELLVCNPGHYLLTSKLKKQTLKFLLNKMYVLVG